MINNSNITKRSTESKSKKDNKSDTADSTKNSRKTSSVGSPASKSTVSQTTSTIDKTADSTKNKSIEMLPLKLDNLNKDKKENRDKDQLSYYEKQVLKELKGIKKASKNILKTLKKINN
ncbi:hypothetical protein [Candidatus Nitrosocosmicus franklandus]|uniref:Uncharacterized protein n=1 Tax=Candidatus Nitrosocosmicus franklandianus TaxID=1798806 RepID=A0A484IBI9_9ARCH|nr:hypothetical protein [Candidatus Nitrosocosmicus franklandus]VFJ14144.1 conserved protein of unknown function [Candidatus Nitrosocosmicus franklandus]